MEQELTKQKTQGEQLTKIQKRRRELQQITQEAKAAQKKASEAALKEGNMQLAIYYRDMSVNAAIKLFIYEGKELRTFRQWKEDGYYIKRGAKAKLLWGRPVISTQDGTKQVEDEAVSDDDILLYPIVFLFSEDDVFKHPEE